jgi:hypothetical protein
MGFGLLFLIFQIVRVLTIEADAAGAWVLCASLRVHAAPRCICHDHPAGLRLLSAHSAHGGTAEYELSRCKHCMELFKAENCMDVNVVSCTEYDVMWFKSLAYVVGLTSVPLSMSSL